MSVAHAGMRLRVAKALLLCGSMAVAISLAPPARAETLTEALAAAYATNPDLNAERAALRGTDENVPRAKSALRPTVTGSANTGRRLQRTQRTRGTVTTTNPITGATTVGPRTSRDDSWPSGYSVTLDQTIFEGLQNVNAIRAAEASVRAGREQLRATEQQVLLDGVIAYVDVLRDKAVVGLRENNVKVLTEQLKATQDRFDVGEVTRTDVAQSEASRSGATSALTLAQANLKSSRATYEEVIGHPPAGLQVPPPVNGLLPHSLEEALYAGDSENPNILAAVFTEEAAEYTLKQLKGQLLPSVSLEATYSDSFDPTSTIDRREDTTVIGRVNVPLYQGGEVAAQVRQAKDLVLQRRRELDLQRTGIRSDVAAAWSRLNASRAQIKSDQDQVDANKIALAGVREEEKVGQRTVLDVLDAEQALLDSQVILVTTKRDLVVASYTLLAAVGRLDAKSLQLPVEYYDPLDHYERVKNKWWGLNAEPRQLLDR